MSNNMINKLRDFCNSSLQTFLNRIYQELKTSKRLSNYPNNYLNDSIGNFTNSSTNSSFGDSLWSGFTGFFVNQYNGVKSIGNDIGSMWSNPRQYMIDKGNSLGDEFDNLSNPANFSKNFINIMPSNIKKGYYNASAIQNGNWNYIGNSIGNDLGNYSEMFALAGMSEGIPKLSALSKAETLESGVRGEFKTEELLTSHFEKHASEFGNITQEQYLAKAQKFVKSNPSRNILTKIRANGDVVFYNKSTNEFAVKASNGSIRTYFKPTGGLDYFNRQ